MKYSINQMANLLGITTHKLRHYQKMGIIKPEIDKNTNYRYFSVLDTRRFNLACFYSSLGYSLNEIVNLLNNQKIEKIVDSLNLTKQQINQEILLKQLSIKRIEELENELINLEKDLGKVKKIQLETQVRLEVSNQENPNKYKNLQQQKNTLLKYSPLIQWVSRIPNDILKNPEQELKYHYGINMKLKDAKALNIDIQDLDIIEKGEYLYTVFVKNSRDDFSWDTLKNLFQYLKDNNIKEFKDAYSSCIHSRIKDGDYENFHYILLKL